MAGEIYMLHNHQHDFLVLFLKPSKKVVLASGIKVEMLVILCHQAITCKMQVRRFEAATLIPMSGYAIESPLYAFPPVQHPLDLVQRHLIVRLE